MIMHGMVEEGVTVVKSLRARYDGKKRNPWNEFECGSNYARSLASYALLQAYSGFTFDMTRKMIGFKPVTPGDFRCFWSLGHAWGEFSRNDQKAELSVIHGRLEIGELQLHETPETLEINGCPIPFVISKHGVLVLEQPLGINAGDELIATT
jgi:hypothetical protein